MKKLVQIIFGAIFIMVALTSCVALPSSARGAEVRIVYINDSGIYHTPVIADLEVQQSKITGTASGRQSEFEQLKVLATENALSKTNADVLVEPRYSWEIAGYDKMTMQVTGYPATYKNFRSISELDSLFIRNNRYLNTINRADTPKEDDSAKATKSKKNIPFKW